MKVWGLQQPDHKRKCRYANKYILRLLILTEDSLENQDAEMSKSMPPERLHQLTSGTQPRTASIRQRPTSSRITSTELEELFQRQRGEDTNGTQSSLMSSSCFQGGYNTLSHPGSPTKSGRVYASVAEMKRSRNKVSQ